MGKYDNYSNKKNIRKAQKKLNRLTRKWSPDQYQIELAQAELDKELMFESCQIFKSSHTYAPNDRIMFSDDNRVMRFFSHVIRYDDIQSYSIVENIVSKSHTVTNKNGVISRAVAGHVIAGSVGAVVGAMSAGSRSETTYYQEGDGFIFQVFLKNGNRHYCEIPNLGSFSNKLPPKWLDVGAKIQRIIDGKN